MSREQLLRSGALTEGPYRYFSGFPRERHENHGKRSLNHPFVLNATISGSYDGLGTRAGQGAEDSPRRPGGVADEGRALKQAMTLARVG